MVQRYKFTLSDKPSIQGSVPVDPIYRNLSINDAKDPVNMFFRKTVEGDVSFVGQDYDFIMSKSPRTIFYLNIIDPNSGFLVQRCYFRYVDMEIDTDNQAIKVKLQVNDGYQKIIPNLETEYDLVRLRPRLVTAKYQVSNCLQITTALGGSIANVYRRNIISTDSSLLGFDELRDNLFAPQYFLSTLWIKMLQGDGTFKVVSRGTLEGRPNPPTSSSYDEAITFYDNKGTYPEGVVPDNYTVYKRYFYYDKFSVTKGEYTMQYQVRLDLNYIDGQGITTYTMSILAFKEAEEGSSPVVIQSYIAGDKLGYPWDGRDSDMVTLVSGELTHSTAPTVYHPAGNITLGPGTFYYNYIYARLLSRDSKSGDGSVPIDRSVHSDVLSDYYNFLRPYPLPGGLKISTRFSTGPSEYGIAYTEGSGNNATVFYYQTPDDTSEYEPFQRKEWSNGWSLWIDKNAVFDMFQSEQTNVTNSNFCEVGDAIQVLLRKVDPDIKFEPSKEFSQFLYGDKGLYLSSDYPLARNRRASILLTQKSNTTKPDSDYYAAKAPVTLGGILAMLREAFNIYWFIDEDKRFRMEHISWFLNNGGYSPSFVPANLKNYRDRYNKKQFSLGTGKYSYDVSREYTSRKLTWQEKASERFTEGEAKMLESYDDSNKTQEGSVRIFTPDIEYCAIFGSTLTQDGFTVVVALEREKSVYSVPIIRGCTNGDMALETLFRKWLKYGMPSHRFVFNNTLQIKVEQPAFIRKNTVHISEGILSGSLYQTVTTSVGNGHITRVTRDLDTGYTTLDLEYERE